MITGIICIGLGIWLFCSPTTSLPVLAYVFAGCMLAAGILNLAYSVFAGRVAYNWGWSLAMGILEIIAGVWLFTLPEAALTVAFMYIVGIWILVVAINSLCEVAMLSSGANAWLVWVICLLLGTIFLSIVFLAGPVAGGIAVWLYLGISFILFGVMRISLAGRLRTLTRRF